jgi:alpha,alpha-trehalase
MLLAPYPKAVDADYLLARIDAIEKYYAYWTSGPHLTPATGLSRYFDTGEGPAPEVVASELDRKGRTDYELIAAWYRKHKTENAHRYYDVAHDRLTPLFYKADRAMRESGFDPSSRFGPFSSEILDYNPACLNGLLYKMERETEQILRIAGQERKAERWGRRAEERAAAINRLMWDPRTACISTTTSRTAACALSVPHDVLSAVERHCER